DADRAAGPVDQFDVRRQQILQPEAVDRMSVPPAYLHEAIAPLGICQPPNFVGGSGYQIRFTELVDKLHCFISPWSQPFTTAPFRSGFVPRFLRFAETVALNLLHRCLPLAECGQHAHLINGLRLADLAHCEADMNEDPIAGCWGILLQQSEVDSSPHS